jgi:hypothetical protein
MRSALLWDFTHRIMLVLTDVVGQPIGSTFKGLPLKMGPIGCPETLVRN